MTFWPRKKHVRFIVPPFSSLFQLALLVHDISRSGEYVLSLGPLGSLGLADIEIFDIGKLS